ncbi:hypothetical protein AAC387_Pa01g4233 [Persea americana]
MPASLSPGDTASSVLLENECGRPLLSLSLSQISFERLSRRILTNVRIERSASSNSKGGFSQAVQPAGCQDLMIDAFVSYSTVEIDRCFG